MRRKGRDARGDVQLPGYADLEEIGGSPFATVFRAVETATRRPVAVKVLKADTVSPSLMDSFRREIEALAAVSHHPHIVTLYRLSTTADGGPVLVLELCRESLGDQVRAGGPLEARQVTDIGIKIAGALETAHRNGFLHRAMKPQNILVTHFGQPALSDFGVAALHASARMTDGSLGFVTLHVAPETLEGRPPSPATDVYGLASTMYELLTGRAPFGMYGHEAPAPAILRILRDPVVPLRAEHIPLGLADLIESALAKAPEGRPRSAAEFAGGLRAVEAEQGWADTPLVAWGQEGPDPPPAPSTNRSRRTVDVPPLLPPPSATPPIAAQVAPPPAATGPTAPRPPSVAHPEPTRRNVVEPEEEGRGLKGTVPPAPRPAEWRPTATPVPHAPTPSARPVFPDPEPPGGPEWLGTRPAPRRSTGPPTHGLVAPADQPGPMHAAWSVAAVAVAVLIIIAAALVVAGVL